MRNCATSSLISPHFSCLSTYCLCLEQVIFELKIMLASGQAVIQELSGLPSFPDISARVISAWTFITETFRHVHVLALRTHWHKEFSAPWTFWQGIFRHLNISAHGYFCTLQSNMDVLAQTFLHLCYCAKMSIC